MHYLFSLNETMAPRLSPIIIPLRATNLRVDIDVTVVERARARARVRLFTSNGGKSQGLDLPLVIFSVLLSRARVLGPYSVILPRVTMPRRIRPETRSPTRSGPTGHNFILGLGRR